LNDIKLQQGLQLLDAMDRVFTVKQWRMDEFDEECKEWLLLLLEIVNCDHNLDSLLLEFIPSQCYVVAKRHQRFIVDQVRTL